MCDRCVEVGGVHMFVEVGRGMRVRTCEISRREKDIIVC